MRETVLASGNPGKLSELSAMLEPLGWHLRSQADFGIAGAEETGLSFVENAILKARHTAEATGRPALADDSGIVVSALDGRPGIYSSRYAGAEASDPEMRQKVLDEMAAVPDGEREALFFCALVLLEHATDPCPIIAEGRWHGAIAHQAIGSYGFGYDPIFWVPERRCTAAELPPEEKGKLSHRGRALRELRRRLEIGE